MGRKKVIEIFILGLIKLTDNDINRIIKNYDFKINKATIENNRMIS